MIGGKGHNLVSQAQDSASRTVTYGYDAVTEDLLQATDIGGGITKFTYDSAHQLLTMRDPNFTAAGTACNGGNGVANVYTSGQVTQQTDYLGRVTHYDYTSIPFTTKVTDPKGRTYDDAGRRQDEVLIDKGVLTRSDLSDLYARAWRFVLPHVKVSPLA